MKKISKDKNGASSSMVLVALVGVLALVLLYLSGTFSISLPSMTDEFEETVNRDATDLGIMVPIEVRLGMSANADTSAQEATIQTYVKHKHDSADSVTGDVVPDAEIITASNFNTKVGSTGDTSTIYTTNGNSFTASNVTYGSTVTSIGGTNFGLMENNYKVWTKDTTYTPPASVGTTSTDNSVIHVACVVSHYRKATSELLSKDEVKFAIYYSMPDYDEDEAYTESYTYYLYIPFNDYAAFEDIKLQVWGFYEQCKIEWTSVETVTHTWWSFPIFNTAKNCIFPGATFKLVQSTDVAIPTRIQYTWTDPWAVRMDNDKEYASHYYTYKVR